MVNKENKYWVSTNTISSQTKIEYIFKPSTKEV